MVRRTGSDDDSMLTPCEFVVGQPSGRVDELGKESLTTPITPTVRSTILFFLNEVLNFILKTLLSF